MVVATEPLGERNCVTNAEHPEHDATLNKLLSFVGALVGGASHISLSFATSYAAI